MIAAIIRTIYVAFLILGLTGNVHAGSLARGESFLPGMQWIGDVMATWGRHLKDRDR